MSREGTGTGRAIRVRGLVQGVGFRPTVWRVARSLSLSGVVRNDSEGVLIEAWGTPSELDDLVRRLREAPPPLARIDAIETMALTSTSPHEDFRIDVSAGGGEPTTGVVADAASCAQCIQETLDPLSRRFRYPFTNCTECGPRFSIIRAIPYDRTNTSMSGFPMCADCLREYEEPSDRRFHAQPNACHVCGPRAQLQRADGRPFFTDALSPLDDVDAAAGALLRGHIVAIKGLGGYHLACDATNAETVATLRARKRRYQKPLAMMARDLDVIRRYCEVSDAEREALTSPGAPIVLLQRSGPDSVAPAVAPDSTALGFMLPATPLHHLLFRRLSRPMVMTSGNLSEVPPCTDDADARTQLGAIAEYFLVHNRPIENRIDDSVVRLVAGTIRVLRRARGYAPAPLQLPPGFEASPRILALGGELKNTFCLFDRRRAIVSQHMGDLEDARTYQDFRKNLGLYRELYRFQPEVCAVDLHPEYLSTKLGRELASREHVQLQTIQHHHAHVASCMFEHGLPLDGPPVLGVALDGLGYGSDGSWWGGEFLLATYATAERLGTFKPVAMLGGHQAMREPWRNTFAHLVAEMSWPEYRFNFADLELTQFLESKPVPTLLAMLGRPEVAPAASSCGRLFDAVAAAVGLHREKVSFEGQAAMALEAQADDATIRSDAFESAYPFAIPRLGGGGLPYVEPLAMWRAVCGDLLEGSPVGVISARFHKGLARIVAAMVSKLCRPEEEEPRTDTVVLSGGVFQNRLLVSLLTERLEADGYRVLLPRELPANDGGISVGQAAIAAARHLLTGRTAPPCA